MQNITTVLQAIREISPERLQESWDNTGIQILPDVDAPVHRILVCLEINDEIVEEAVRKKADLIVTHHPLMFRPVGSITPETAVGRQSIRLIQNNIAVYSSHTAFDSAPHGTNQDLAEQLELQNIRPMLPSPEDARAGMGRYGEYFPPKDFSDFIALLERVCTEDPLRTFGVIPEQVSCAALCTGAGAEFMKEALSLGADVYITGDVKYHEARDAADQGFCLIDAGHYGTEIQFASNMAAQLRDRLTDVEIMESDVCINPLLNLGGTVSAALRQSEEQGK